MGEFALLLTWVGAVRSSCEAICLEADELREDAGLLRAEARRLREESGSAVGRSTIARETRRRIWAARRKDVMSMPEGSEAVTRAQILIADDNRDTREMHALYLSMLGYNVAVAADGREAVQSARGHHPDLIVMDLDMPEADGWTAIRELRSDALTAAIPVIVLTGHDLKTELKDVALAVGAVAYLMKPCFPEELAREVSGRLAVRRARIAGAL